MKQYWFFQRCFSYETVKSFKCYCVISPLFLYRTVIFDFYPIKIHFNTTIELSNLFVLVHILMLLWKHFPCEDAFIKSV